MTSESEVLTSQDNQLLLAVLSCNAWVPARRACPSRPSVAAVLAEESSYALFFPTWSSDVPFLQLAKDTLETHGGPAVCLSAGQ